MVAHRIHLKGPWDFVWHASDTASGEMRSRTGTVAMPQDWVSLFGAEPGTARFQRKFHRPTNLEPHERVLLILTEVRGAGSVQLNDQPVGEFRGCGAAIEFELTAILNPFNVLSIEMTFHPANEPSLPGGLYGPVALEIRSDDSNSRC